MADLTQNLSDSLSISESLGTGVNYVLGPVPYGHTPLLDGSVTYGGNPLEDSISFTESIALATVLSLTDNIETTDELLKLKPFSCGTVKTSKFGEFKYAQNDYGMSVDFQTCVSISESLLRKFNDAWLWDLSDSISFSEELTTEVEFYLELSDSLSISESLIDTHEIKRTLSDSLVIAESVANKTTLSISDSITFVAPSLLEMSIEEGIVLSTGWKFYIRDSSGNRVASLVNARDRWFKEALNHGGSAGFKLDTLDDSCNSTILAINSNELIIEYNGYTMFGGQISTITKVAEGNDIYWEVIAKQFFNLLEQKFCGYNKSTGISDAREFTSTDAGTIAWTLIDEAQSETYGDLGITQGTIETSLSRTKSYERKNIAQAILELSESDFGFDFEVTADKVFNVYYPFKGTTQNDVVFRYPGNCHSIESFENGWDVVNHVLGLGKHWGGEEIQYVGDNAASQSSYGRRESIESYKDIEILAFLTDMVEEDIAYNKDINKVIKFSSFVDDKTEPYRYELGDSVRVVADDLNLNEMLYVYERKFQIDDNDEVVVGLTLGD